MKTEHLITSVELHNTGDKLDNIFISNFNSGYLPIQIQITVHRFWSSKLWATNITAPKMKFSIKHFFSKCEQIRRKLQIWSHLLKKSLVKNFIFCAVISTAPLTLSLE